MLKRGYWWGIAIALIGAISFFFDRQILSIINLTQNIALDKVLMIFDSMFLYLGLALLIIIMLLIKKDRKTVVNFGLAMILTLLFVFFIKLLFARERPFELVEFITNTNIQDYSFPSNHSAIIFAILPFLIRLFKKLSCFWWIIAVIVGFSRVYFGVHYLSDVIFGALAGLLISSYMIAQSSGKSKSNRKKAKKKKF